MGKNGVNMGKWVNKGQNDATEYYRIISNFH